MQICYWQVLNPPLCCSFAGSLVETWPSLAHEGSSRYAPARLLHFIWTTYYPSIDLESAPSQWIQLIWTMSVCQWYWIEHCMGEFFFTIFQTTKITLHSCFQKKISHPTNSKVLNKWIFYGYWNYSLIYHFGNVWKTTLEPRFHLGELASDAARCEIPPPRCERVLGGDLFGSGEKNMETGNNTNSLVVFQQPIWKICCSNWTISPIFGVNIKNTKNHHLEKYNHQSIQDWRDGNRCV